MTEIGRVISLERGIVSLALENETACGGCAVRPVGDGQGPASPASVCPVCAAFGHDKPRTLAAVNSAHLQLAVGDRVVVFLDPKKTVAGAIFLFVLPLSAFLLSYAALLILMPSAPDEARLLCGAIGFALSYFFVFMRRLIRNRKDWPVVIEKSLAVQAI